MATFNSKALIYLETIAKCLGDLSSDTDTNQELLEQILLELQNQPQIEGLDPIAICDENGVSGYVAFYLDEETNVVTELFFDASGQPTNVRPIGSPCLDKSDFEFKFFETEKCLSDGTKVIEVLCLTYENGEEVSQDTFWVVDGVKVSSEPLGLTDCVIECEPTMSDAYGDDLSTLSEGTSFVITKPKCCDITVTTSIGSFSLRRGETYYGTTTFECPVEVTGVSITGGNCSLSDIHIISNKHK